MPRWHDVRGSCSVAKSSPTLCDPTNCNMQVFPVLHCLPEFTQIHFHWVSDVIRPSHPLLSSSLALSLPQHQSFSINQLFASGGQSIRSSASAPVLPMNIQGWFPWRLTDLISLLSKRLSSVFSSTTVWKHPFFGAQPSLWSSSHIPTWPTEKPRLWL